MSKKIKLTSRGKIVISVISAILVIAISVAGFSVFKNNSTPDYAEEVYGYGISHILEQSIVNEQSAREELRQNIEDANKLVKETDGKIFDASRANLQTYVNNIIDVPDSQKVESENFVDYVNSEKRIRSFINNLSDKQTALQNSYDAWSESRNEMDKSADELENDFTTGISNADELEKAIQRNIEESERLAQEREEKIRLREEERRRNSQQNKPQTIPTQPSVPQPVEPEKPTQKPSPEPTKPPSTPTLKPTPTPTEKPVSPPKTTPTPKPTNPVETTPPADENEGTEMPGDATMIGQENG